jgi:hypothetical protein
MKIIIAAIFAALLVAVLLSEGYAQTPPPEVFDLRTDEFRWDYPVSEPVTEFRVKCGPTKGGPYSLSAAIPNPLARSFPMRGVITVGGEYACISTAVNGTLESKVSNEVFFSAEVGALIPGNFRLQKAKP